MSDGLAHCGSIRVVKLFEIIKQFSSVIFDIVIALRIDIHSFTHACVMDTAKIPFGHLQTFRIAKNRKFRENVITARAESFLLCMVKCFLRAFVMVPLTFYSSMRQSYDTGCASPLDAQFHRTLYY